VLGLAREPGQPRSERGSVEAITDAKRRAERLRRGHFATPKLTDACREALVQPDAEVEERPHGLLRARAAAGSFVNARSRLARGTERSPRMRARDEPRQEVAACVGVSQLRAPPAEASRSFAATRTSLEEVEEAAITGAVSHRRHTERSRNGRKRAPPESGVIFFVSARL
jgi:hypothetical protein